MSPTQGGTPWPVALRQAATAKGGACASLYDSMRNYGPCPLVHDDVLARRDRSHVTASFIAKLASEVRRPAVEALP